MSWHLFPEAETVMCQTRKNKRKITVHIFIVYLQHITNVAQVRTASVHFILCLLYVSCVRLWQHLQGVDCGLKRASGPCLLACDWLARRGPVDELDSDSKLQIAARQPPPVYSYSPTAPHPSVISLSSSSVRAWVRALTPVETALLIKTLDRCSPLLNPV